MNNLRNLKWSYCTSQHNTGHCLFVVLYNGKVRFSRMGSEHITWNCVFLVTEPSKKQKRGGTIIFHCLLNLQCLVIFFAFEAEVNFFDVAVISSSVTWPLTELSLVLQK